LLKTKPLLTATLTLTLAGSAYADFYVVEDQSTHRCTVVSQQPMPGMMDRVVGDGGYKSQQEAQAAMRAELACSNTPMGSGPTTTTGGPAFYVVQDLRTKRCSIVDRHAEDTTTSTQVGAATFKSRIEADAAMRRERACR
jgi:hypothetical protein